MAETKITIAGEIYDLNKELKHSTPYNRKKSIQIMLNGFGSAKGYTKAELKEIRSYLLKEKALNEAGQKKTVVKKSTVKTTTKRAVKAAKPLKSKPVPKKTETKKTTSKKARYSAKKVNGKGYIFDRNFSLKVPIAVEKTYEKAAEYVKKYNEEK